MPEEPGRGAGAPLRDRMGPAKPRVARTRTVAHLACSNDVCVSLDGRGFMAQRKSPHAFEKRQRELRKRKKREEKAQRKRERRSESSQPDAASEDADALDGGAAGTGGDGEDPRPSGDPEAPPVE